MWSFYKIARFAHHYKPYILFKPETEWGSTQIGMEHQNLKPSKKTVAQVVKFIKDKTKIEFKINESSLNAGTTPVTKALNTVSKVRQSITIVQYMLAYHCI